MHIEDHKFTKIKAHFILQLFGIILLVFSILFLNNYNLNIYSQKNIFNYILFSHPGLITLVPVTGTFLIIFYSDKKNFINKILSFRPIVFIGLISFSLYLWHLPIFSFLRISLININSYTEYFLIFFLIFGLSITSYYLIELPFRNRNLISNLKVIYIISFIILIIIFLSHHAIKNNGYSNLIPKYFNEFKIYDKSGNPLFSKKKLEKKNINLNLTNPFNETRFGNVIIIGDSHAGDLKEELEIHLNKRDLNLNNLSYLNIFSLDFFNVRKNGKMKSLKKELIQILEYRNVSTIILMSRFPLYWHQKGFDNLKDNGKEVHTYINYFKDKNFQNLPEKKRKKMISESFNNSVLELLNQEINVIIVYPVPEAGYWIPEYLASKIIPKIKINYFLNKINIKNQYESLSIEEYVTNSYDLYLERNREIFEMLNKIDHPKLYRTYPDKIFCKIEKNSCYTHDEDYIYYRDNNHLSKKGLKLILPDLIKIFDKIENN